MKDAVCGAGRPRRDGTETGVLKAEGALQNVFFFDNYGGQKQKRIPFLKNKPENLLKTNDRHPKTNPNKPKNKAGKLLKIRSCGKNKPKNKPGHVVENNGWRKNELESKVD